MDWANLIYLIPPAISLLALVIALPDNGGG